MIAVGGQGDCGELVSRRTAYSSSGRNLAVSRSSHGVWIQLLRLIFTGETWRALSYYDYATSQDRRWDSVTNVHNSLLYSIHPLFASRLVPWTFTLS